MTTTAVQDGKTINHAHTAAVASGEALVIGGLLGIAAAAYAANESGAYYVTGVHDIPKVDAAVIAAGDTVMWNTAAGEVDDHDATPAAGDLDDFGIAWEALGATTGARIKVKINTGTGAVS